MRVEWSDNEASNLGSAAHEVIEDHVLHTAGYRSSTVPVEEVAAKWEVDPNDLWPIYRLAVKAWSEWGHLFSPRPRTEIELAHGLLIGHVDVLSVLKSSPTTEAEPRILDWKTGRRDADHRQQLMGYGWLALQEYPHARRVYACQIRVRDLVIEGRWYSRAEIDQWHSDLAAHLDVPEVYRPSAQWCVHCPRAATCPAKTELLRQCYQAIVWESDFELLPPSGPALGSALHALKLKVKLLETAAEHVKDLIKAKVIEVGGKIETEDGHELFIKTITNREINARRALPVLHETLGDKVFDAVEVGKTKLEKIVRDGADKGSKGQAVKDAMALLESHDAVTKTESDRLEVRRTAKLLGVAS